MEIRALPNGVNLYHLNWGETQFLYDEIFVANTYLQHGIELGDDDIVFDVGANIGVFALFAHQKSTRIHLYSFEPIPEIFRVLEANVALHGVRATLFDCALSDHIGSAVFTFYPNNSVMSGRYADSKEDTDTTRTFIGNKDASFMREASRDPDFAEHANSVLARLFESRTCTVELKTLSRVLSTHDIERVDLLKIDVEKSEHEVLAGIEEDDWKRIRQVVAEVHDIDGRVDAVTKLLSRHGFKVRLAQDPLLTNTGIHNVYARR
jgi:FkbM family methyltransferase